jgi:G3E family GTPase
MERIARERQSEELPGAILVEPTGLGCPGAYVPRTLRDVFLKDGINDFKMHHGPQVKESLNEVRIDPVEIMAVRTRRRDGREKYSTAYHAIAW